MIRQKRLFMDYIRFEYRNESEEEREKTLEWAIRHREDLEKELEKSEFHTARAAYGLFTSSQAIVFRDLFGIFDSKENLDKILGMDSELFLQCERSYYLSMILKKDQE